MACKNLAACSSPFYPNNLTIFLTLVSGSSTICTLMREVMQFTVISIGHSSFDDGSPLGDSSDSITLVHNFSPCFCYRFVFTNKISILRF